MRKMYICTLNIAYIMAKKKAKSYTEAELVKTFQLERIIQYPTDLMKNWLAVKPPVFTIPEAAFFEEIYQEALLDIINWNEEDLKMKLGDRKVLKSYIDYMISLNKTKSNEEVWFYQNCCYWISFWNH